MDEKEPMTPSAICEAWIKHCEGCKLTAYADNGAYSIGYGHRGLPEGTVWVPAQAEAAFVSDLSMVAKMVNALVVVPLTQGQFDALVDFVFNLGAGRLQRSTLLRKLNVMKDYDGACAELARWNMAGGGVNAGLAARRKGDQTLWNGGNPLEGL